MKSVILFLLLFYLDDKQVAVFSENRTLDLEFPTPAEAKVWFEGLTVLYEVKIFFVFHLFIYLL